jgi:biotin operon repressor
VSDFAQAGAFAQVWNSASCVADVAAALSISKRAASSRANKLRRRGVELKKFRVCWRLMSLDDGPKCKCGSLRRVNKVGSLMDTCGSKECVSSAKLAMRRDRTRRELEDLALRVMPLLDNGLDHAALNLGVTTGDLLKQVRRLRANGFRIPVVRKLIVADVHGVRMNCGEIAEMLGVCRGVIKNRNRRRQNLITGRQL